MSLNPTHLSVHLGRTEKLTQMGTTIEEEEGAGPGTNGTDSGKGEREGGLKHIYPMVTHRSAMPIFTCHVVLTHGQTQTEEC